VEVLTDLLAASIRLAVPVILTSIGLTYSERSGVTNIGTEGMMLLGAFAAVTVTRVTGNLLLATATAMLAGGLLSLIHAYVSVTRRANQIVSGFTINLLALGLTNVLHAWLTTGTRARVILYPVLTPDALRQLPFLGPVLLGQRAIVWLAIVLPLVAAWVLYRTTWGLNIRAVGEHSRATAAAGLPVFRLRYLAVLISGVCAGLGGSALALADLGYFVPGMTAGRGFIAQAAVVVGRWNPLLVAVACLLFGAGNALQVRLQMFESSIPYQFPVMLPYLLTIIAVAVGSVGRTAEPKELGKPYNPQEES